MVTESIFKEVDGGGGVMAGHKPALILILLTALEFLESLYD